MHTYDIVFGIHPVRELLRAKRRKIYALLTTDPAPHALQEIINALPHAQVPVRSVSRQHLTQLAQNTDHQGVVAQVAPYPYRKKMFQPTQSPFLLMLDGIQDPRNLGAIARSAYCTGVDGIILTQKGSVDVSAVALKASAGLAEHLEIYQTPTAVTGMQELQRAGYNLYLALVEKSTQAQQVQYQTPLCVVIGSEGKGITRALHAQGTHITIPQRHTGISYNASVAAGILLYIVGTHIKKI